MMDGMIAAIRKGSTRRIRTPPDHGYSAKYASSFYGPFREPQAPVWRPTTYQMAPTLPAGQAMREIALDVNKRRYIMVKPAPLSGYRPDGSEQFPGVPAAYNVSENTA